MSNEYQPLAKLIEQGLQEGTVLECERENGHFVWDGCNIERWSSNPFGYKWRIVSTPPKKITFETEVHEDQFGNPYVSLPHDTFGLKFRVIVTVEEKR